jgi:DNA-directed RNA polymerase specialized sigma24 family protein
MTLKEIAALIESDEDTVRVTMRRASNRFNQLPSGAWEVMARAG